MEILLRFVGENALVWEYVTTRIWEKIAGLPLEVGIRDSSGSTRCWELAR
jgi:hypothetical protein